MPYFLALHFLKKKVFRSSLKLKYTGLGGTLASPRQKFTLNTEAGCGLIGFSSCRLFRDFTELRSKCFVSSRNISRRIFMPFTVNITLFSTLQRLKSSKATCRIGLNVLSKNGRKNTKQNYNKFGIFKILYKSPVWSERCQIGSIRRFVLFQ